MIRDTDSMDSQVVKTRPWWRRHIVLLAVAVVLLSLWWWMPALARWNQAERTVDASRLRMATVERGDLERDVAVQGRIVAAFHPKLFSAERGIVTLHVRPGEVVTEGSTLATIESPELLADIERQRSQVASQEGQLASQRIASEQQRLAETQRLELTRLRRQAAARELERARRLFDQGLLNRGDFERAEDTLQIATLEQQHAESTVALSADGRRLDLQQRSLEVERQRVTLDELLGRRQRLSIVAPFDGMVAGLDVQDRDAVLANQPVLTVVDLTSFEIEIQIPENYADEIAPGMSSKVLYDGEEYAAEVTSIAPQVAASQVEARMTFVGEPPQGLRQNQRLSCQLILERRLDVLKIPRGPYLESGGGRSIYVLHDGMAELRPIRVGATSVTTVEILEGLTEGDEVLLTEVNRFRGAKRVRVRNGWSDGR